MDAAVSLGFIDPNRLGIAGEGYGGTLTARAQDGIFHLNALIPEPQGGDDA